MADHDEPFRDGVRVDSTTDSYDEVRASLGLPATPETEAADVAEEAATDGDTGTVSVRTDQEPMAQVEEATSAEGIEAGVDTEEAHEAPAESDGPVRPSRPRRKRESADQRIGKAVARQRDAERESERLRLENERLLQSLQTPGPNPGDQPQAEEAQVPEAQAASEEPAEADYPTFSEYQEAHAQWREQNMLEKVGEVVDSKLHERAEVSRRAQYARDVQTREAAYQQRLADARERHADFDTLVGGSQDVPVSPPMESIIRNTPGGTEVLYHLCNNPEEAARIAELPPSAAIYEMGILSQQLGVASMPGSETSERDRAASPTSGNGHAGTTSNAHLSSRLSDPVEPVGGGTTSSTVPVDQMDFQAYKTQRLRDLQARQGR